jgi:hypothetical protein
MNRSDLRFAQQWDSPQTARPSSQYERRFAAEAGLTAGPLKTRDAPMNQAHEAQHPARPHRSRGTMTHTVAWSALLLQVVAGTTRACALC